MHPLRLCEVYLKNVGCLWQLLAGARDSSGGCSTAAAAMDLSSLPTPVLCIIHNLVIQAGGIRSALSLEAASKELCTLLRANTRFRDFKVPLGRGPPDRCRAAFWRFVAAHGHRLDRLELHEQHCWRTPSATSSGNCLPPLSVQEGVRGARSVAVPDCSSCSTLEALAGLPNLHHLSCCIDQDSSRALDDLEQLTALQSLALDGHCSQSSLPALPRLTALTRLQLCHLPRLTTLDLQTCHAANLQALDLCNLGALTTLAPIYSLTRLTSLSLERTHTGLHVNELAALGCLQNLRRLSLYRLWPPEGHGASLTSVGALSPLTSLEVLNITPMSFGHLVSSLEGIGDLAASLQRLQCNAYGISNLDPLSVLRSLQTLDLYHLDQVSELGRIGHLPSLRQLRISHGWHISSLAPLRWLDSVQELNLEYLTKVRSLQPIGSLSALQQLRLLGLHMVSSLQPLSQLRYSLQLLRLEGMGAVSSLEPLSQLRSLQRLYLGRVGAVSSLQPLTQLPSLQRLCLERMGAVSSLEPLSQLRSLQRLYLGRVGAVSSLQPLSQLRSLQLLRLEGMWAVSSLEPLSALTGLRDLTLVAADCRAPVTKFHSSHLAPLDFLTGLQKLEIHDRLKYTRTATPARPAIIFPGECIRRAHSSV
jgi:hypothetical protein